jgi:xanthine dehydrogenase molybdopterin-binding subunit B
MKCPVALYRPASLKDTKMGKQHIDVSSTDSAPYDEGIKGARGMHVEGRAVASAAAALVETLRTAAAAHWGTKIEDISWTGGKRIL